MKPVRNEMPAKAVIDWLLAGEPYVKYRVLRDLFGKDETESDVQVCRRMISSNKLIKDILEKQNRDGYWGSPTAIYTWWPKKDSTFWVLGVLADFGYTKQDKAVARACEYVFSKQLPSGAFGWAPPPTPGECFTGILVESLARLGYVQDQRLIRSYDWLARRQRVDGGFWCKTTGQPGGPRQAERSCAYATLCVLGALARHPKWRKSELAEKSLSFILGCWDNRGKIKYAGHDSQIGKGWEKLKYPYTDYRILKYLDVVSQFDNVKDDARIKAMLSLLLSKSDHDGRFYAESIHKSWAGFDFAQKEKPSRWITFIVYNIAKKLGVAYVFACYG